MLSCGRLLFAIGKPLILVVALVIVGCGDNRVKCHPVNGQVMLNGVPLDGAVVVLHPADETGKYKSIRPIGYTNAEGKFKLTTYTENDGAPEGDWIATVMMKPKDDEGSDQTTSKSKLDWTFARSNTSPLKVTVKAGENTPQPFTVK